MAAASCGFDLCNKGKHNTMIVLLCAHTVRDNRAKCFKNPITTSFDGIFDTFIIPDSVVSDVTDRMLSVNTKYLKLVDYC